MFISRVYVRTGNSVDRCQLNKFIYSIHGLEHRHHKWIWPCTVVERFMAGRNVAVAVSGWSVLSWRGQTLLDTSSCKPQCRQMSYLWRILCRTAKPYDYLVVSWRLHWSDERREIAKNGFWHSPINVWVFHRRCFWTIWSSVQVRWYVL